MAIPIPNLKPLVLLGGAAEPTTIHFLAPIGIAIVGCLPSFLFKKCYVRMRVCFGKKKKECFQHANQTMA